MFVALGMLLDVQYLTADREDGTVLRARATPDGITGYLVGKLVTVSGTVGLYVAVIAGRRSAARSTASTLARPSTG